MSGFRGLAVCAYYGMPDHHEFLMGRDITVEQNANLA